ncbi:MAG: metallophosphoesterase, partial [Eubacteriales bacterium]
MKIKKRFLSLFLALTMLTTMVPASVISASAVFTGALQFDTSGKFTVMQITDIQTGASVNTRIVTMIRNAISRYHPDLVVFTGDNIAGKISSANFQSAVNTFTQPLIDTNTKFAVTFGNHDAESSIFGVNAGSKDSQYNYFMSRGGSLAIDHDVD